MFSSSYFSSTIFPGILLFAYSLICCCFICILLLFAVICFPLIPTFFFYLRTSFTSLLPIFIPPLFFLLYNYLFSSFLSSFFFSFSYYTFCLSRLRPFLFSAFLPFIVPCYFRIFSLLSSRPFSHSLLNFIVFYFSSTFLI